MQSISVPEEEVTRLLERLVAIGRRNSLRDPLANVIAESGLGPAQVHALMWLFRDGALTMGVLAQRVNITDKTITGVVDRLERDGYVTRERSTEDRRVVQVVLAEKGRTLAVELDRMMQQNLRLFLGILDERDRGDLFRILDHVIARLDQQYLAVPVTAPTP